MNSQRQWVTSPTSNETTIIANNLFFKKSLACSCVKLELDTYLDPPRTFYLLPPLNMLVIFIFNVGSSTIGKRCGLMSPATKSLLPSETRIAKSFTLECFVCEVSRLTSQLSCSPT
uniref:Uncharacterized protein n=1 Tax=Vespula pensylvanica TaxID=30213 RepID=A0A834P2E4_VESPE|nr:hypothetical protein H0235_008099 [Vespula pensylvanica]